MQTIDMIGICELLNISLAEANKIIAKDPSFPKLLGITGRVRRIDHKEKIFFDHGAVLAWAEKHKTGLNTVLTQKAIRGQLWPLYKPEPKYLNGVIP